MQIDKHEEQKLSRPVPDLARRRLGKSVLVAGFAFVEPLSIASTFQVADSEALGSSGRMGADTLQYLANRAAIQDLAIFYAVSCDTGQLEATVDCWMPEGSFDERASGFDLLAGHSQIRAFFRDTVFSNFKSTVLLTANHHITDIGETTAKGVVFTLIESLKADGVRSRVQGCYHDEYQKTRGRWRFKSRAFEVTFPREIIGTGH